MKYGTRMEDAAIGSHWRLWKAHSIIIPYIKECNRKNDDVSIGQLQRQLYKLSLEDFLQTSAIETLYSNNRELTDSLSNLPKEVNIEVLLSNIIVAYSSKKTWTINRY